MWLLLLAGGVGSRLNVLVQYRAKPAVPFGGIYRIIDFTLSNIANSGLTRVAVLTQYKPLSLMDHIGDGSAWDMAGRTRGISILPQRPEKRLGLVQGHGRRGAAEPELRLFRNGTARCSCCRATTFTAWTTGRSLAFHRERKASVTIGMIPVAPEETRHFGTATHGQGQKRSSTGRKRQAKARSNLASMGIYVFDRQYLTRDPETKTKEEDFGKQIIPRALKEAHVYGYHFRGILEGRGDDSGLLGCEHGPFEGRFRADARGCDIRTNHTAEALPYDRSPVRISASARAVDSASPRRLHRLRYSRRLGPLSGRRDRKGRVRERLDHYARYGHQAGGAHRALGTGQGDRCR